MPFGLVFATTTVVLRGPGRAARMTTTACRGTAATGVTARMRRAVEVLGAAAGGATRMRGSTTRTAWVRRTTTIVVREVGMTTASRATTGRARVVMGHRTAVWATGRRTTVILGAMLHRTTGVMRYRAAMRATRRSTMRTANGAAVRATEATRRHYAMARELSRARSRRDTGMSVVERRAQLRVTTREVLVVPLHRGRLEVMIVFSHHFMRRGTCTQSTGSAVEGHVIIHVNHSVVVYVRHVHAADVHDRTVIKERTTAPITTLESNTGITEAVVHTAVEADMRTPVAAVPAIDTARPTPVAGGPEQARLRRHHPGTRHPVITVLAVRPIPRRPDVAHRRKWRLHVHRQHRRRYRDRHADLDAGLRNSREHGERGQRERRNQTFQPKITHTISPSPRRILN